MLRSDSNNPKIFNSNEYRKKIEHYSFCLNDKIGRGYSSNVYKGTDDITKQQVAIKVIQLKSLKDDVTKGLLRIQLECINKINHPNLLKCINSYETINNCYIVTEYCEGGDLDKYLKKKGKFTEKQTIKFFHQFYDAYLSFHEAGFIHRDLKPANILLKSNSIRIADFGFVKKTSDAPKNTYNVGTPVYMPPQSLKQNIYTEKSDIWAMGVICYQLVHGRVPWNGLTQAELKFKIENQKPIFDRKLASNDLQDFIERCLTLNPEFRISLKEISEHPWFKNHIQSRNIQKIPSRLPLSEISTQIANRTNIPTQTKLNRNQSTNQFLLGMNTDWLKKQSINERQTIDSYSGQREKQRQRQSNQVKGKKKCQSQKRILDSLITILNFLRFTYKVYRFVNENIEENKKEICEVIGKLVVKELEKHEGVVTSKRNVFEIGDWDIFTKSKKWNVYKEVVQQYSSKYRKTIFKDLKPTVNESIMIRELISQQNWKVREMFKKEQHKGSMSLFREVELMDYLTTLGSMYSLVEDEGWSGFVSKSPINLIVEHDCKVYEDNHREVWEELKSKITEFI